MTELVTIARLYAKAIFEIAKTSNLFVWSDLISEMAEVVKNPDVNILVKNLALTNQQIALTFASILKTSLSNEAINFINILAENNRLKILPEIATQFHTLKNLQEGVINVTIISAFKLSNIQLKNINNRLSKKFNLKLNSTIKIDNTLIGGIRIIVNDQVFDNSIHTKLRQLYVSLIA